MDRTDPHKLGFCCRYACGETCIGCGDSENGLPLPVLDPQRPLTPEVKFRLLKMGEILSQFFLPETKSTEPTSEKETT